MVKKVCIVSPSAYPLLIGDTTIKAAGGAEAQLSVIGLQLAKQGYEITYLVDDFGQQDCVNLNGINIIKVPLRYMGGSNAYLFFDWFRLFKCWEAFKKTS